MKTGKRLVPACMAAVIAASATITSWAAQGPLITSDVPEGYDEETWARLNDNVLEYDELGNLIENFNPNMQTVRMFIDSSLEDLKDQAYFAYKVANDAKDDAKEIKESSDYNTVNGQVEYATNMAMNKVYSGTGEKLTRAVNLMSRPNSSAYSSLKQNQKLLTTYAQQMMIGYDSMLANRDMLVKMQELYATSYEIAAAGVQAGTGTQADLLSAQKKVLEGQSTLMEFDNKLDKLRRDLCSMIGRTPDSLTDIRPVPLPDTGRITAINLETDTAAAIANNYTLISQRHAKGGSTVDTENKQRLVNEGEQKLTIQMQSLYQDILKKKSEYDAAMTAYENALLAKNMADIQYQQGITSKVQYLGQQMAYLQAVGTKAAAELTLRQAMETYDWAVKGIATIS